MQNIEYPKQFIIYNRLRVLEEKLKKQNESASSNTKESSQDISAAKSPVEQDIYTPSLVPTPIGSFVNDFETSSLSIQRMHVEDPRLAVAQRQTLAEKIGQVQGNQHLQSLLSDKESTTSNGTREKSTTIQRDQTITFDEPMVVTGNVTEIGAGRVPTQEIDSQVERLKTQIGLCWQNYRDGLNNFETGMSFESEQEAEPQYLDAALKATAKSAFDEAISLLPSGWSQAVKILKGAIEGVVAEQARADGAAGGAKIGTYIMALRGSIGAKEAATLTGIEGLKQSLADQYTAETAGSINDGGATDAGVIVAEGAEFINNLRQGVDDFSGGIPATAVFHQKFTEAFADTGGWTDLVSHGGRPSGRLYLSLGAYKEGSSWTQESLDSAWTLATDAPKPERLAENLRTALQQQGKKPHESNLPKMVRIRVEHEIDWALNDYYNGSIYFVDSPDDFEVRGWYDSPFVREAWAQYESNVLGITSLRGSGD